MDQRYRHARSLYYQPTSRHPEFLASHIAYPIAKPNQTKRSQFTTKLTRYETNHIFTILFLLFDEIVEITRGIGNEAIAKLLLCKCFLHRIWFLKDYRKK